MSPEQPPDAASALRRAVEESLPRLRAIPEGESARPPAPEKWSPRQILGHLIDSASNNHQRFLRAGFQKDLVFPGYAQNEWVEAQNYRDAPWAELVELWGLYNRHLARVMEATPEALRKRERRRHNFDHIAFRKLPEGSPATLDYLHHDYVAHLEHHLAQIFPAAKAP